MTDAILVVGSGVTSRANVEALMDDYFYANPELKVYLAIDGEASQGQVWSAQYATDKGKTTIAFMTRGSRMIGIPTATPRTESESPILAICEAEKELVGFVIWNDEDPACLEALEILSKYGVSALDLTNGLLEIKPVGEIVKPERVEIPKAEQFNEAELDSREQETEVSPIELSEEDEEEVYEDPLYEAINVVAGIVAGIFADAFAKHLQKGLKK